MNLSTAIQHAIDGNAVLFIGSGASEGAIPIKGKTFLTGKELAIHLSKLAELVPESDDLNYAAQRYRKKISDTQLVKELQDLFTAVEVTESHRRLADLTWKAIYTTNYDNVIERAFAERKKKVVPVTPDMDSREFTSRKNCVLHINGFIDTITTAALNDSFKLTNSSYLTESFAKSNWSFLFRRSIESARAVIFVGYSMYDLDIQRILFAGDDLKAKTIFIDRAGKAIEEIESSIQIDFGEVVPIGLNGFWAEVDKVSATYVAQDQSDTFFAFDQIKVPLSGPPLRDDDLFNLVLRGEARQDLVWDKVNSNSTQKYYVNRDHAERAVEAIKRGTSNIIAVADLANGKSMFCLGQSCRLASQGFEIYWLKDDAEDYAVELDRICRKPGQVALIIENYTRRLDDIKNVQLRRSPNLVLILSAKTSLHEIYQSDLLGIFEPDNTIEIDLNRLAPSELESFEEILDTYKLWGERDAWPDRRKRKFLEEDCGGHLSGILLDIVRSPGIQTRFNKLFEPFHAKWELADVVVAASVLKLLGFDHPRESIVSEVLDSNYLYSLDFKRNPLARELLSFREGGVIPRSSVVAKFGLTTSADSRVLVDRLIKIATNAHDRGADSTMYFGIYRDLVTFSVLQAMLPEKGKRDSLIRFYEAIKNLRAAKNQPHFWLQYAIARLASDRPEDLGMAKLFLDTAFAHAQKRKNYHTRHMDNVLARYWIQHAISTSDVTLAMVEFMDGHALLLKQCRTESSESPYRVARQYLTFYNTKRHAFSEKQRMSLKHMSEGILEFIRRLPDHVKEQSTVKFCKGDLESLLADIASSPSSNG